VIHHAVANGAPHDILPPLMLPSLAFLIAATLLAITPGPGIAYVVARTVAGGKNRGAGLVFRHRHRGLGHVLAAVCGLSLLITQSALAFSVIKGIGAAYLIFLGLKMLLARPSSAEVPVVSRPGAGKALRDGILVEALNVKTAIFFLAFIPQFIDLTHAVVPQFILLGAICVALNTAVDFLAVLAAHRLVASGTVKAARERLLTRASGVTMLGLGACVALAKRDA
jgi:threonine/homoserine/homoserine lactone efflux protein